MTEPEAINEEVKYEDQLIHGSIKMIPMKIIKMSILLY